MNRLLKKIYDEVLVYEKDVVSTNKAVDKTINDLIKSYNEELSASEYDELKELLFSAVSTAEHAGFENGVRFTLKMLSSLLHD